MKQGKYFVLHSNCIPVKGAARTAVCDLQTGRIRFLPNLLYDVLFANKKMSIEDIKAKHNNEYNAGIDSYINVLVNEDYGHPTNNLDLFPEMETEWESPFIITNAILDFSNETTYPVEKALHELNDLACQAIQFRFFHSTSVSFIENILFLLSSSRITFIEIFLPFSENHLEIVDVCTRNARTKTIVFHSAEEDSKIHSARDLDVVYSKEKILDESHCGVINTSFFAVNVPTFLESLNFNSCLNRKIGIDKNGNIKNCPSLKTSFGNIADVTISSVIELEEFRVSWNIKKDQIATCKVCEFRYVCTDCRAYIENSNDVFSKPAKCSYNPFTTKWDEKDSSKNEVQII